MHKSTSNYTLGYAQKNLAICLLERATERLTRNLPNGQAAHQEYRSVTEQIFAIKLLIEKAFTSLNYHLWILLTDMIKPFDTVKRKILLEDLRNILDKDELHLCRLLIEDIKLCITCGKEKDE